MNAPSGQYVAMVRDVIQNNLGLSGVTYHASLSGSAGGGGGWKQSAISETLITAWISHGYYSFLF
jgi:hypothetical protein